MERFKASSINRLYFRFFFFYFLTNNIKHVNMYLYLYINKDQRPKTEFKQFWNASTEEESQELHPEINKFAH